jgi:redox-sensitive bicupin YhaK (pirin superfamily)
MIDLVITAKRKDLGGFEVGRVLPFPTHRMVGPFIFFDHIGPANFLPGHGIDVRPHPHIGLSTVTYLITGEMTHRDSLGVCEVIRPGEVNWMTAGRGIVHSERTDPALRASGTVLHGLQAWVALPQEQEETAPAFAHHEGDDLPSYESGGLFARLVAGEAYGVASKVATHSPLFYLHWNMAAGTRAGVPTGYSERAIYVVTGEVEVDGRALVAGQMAIFGKAGQPVVTALTDAVVMALGGEPVGKRYLWWNLVSSCRERLIDARADWESAQWGKGRFSLPPDDHDEWIPVSQDPLPKL